MQRRDPTNQQDIVTTFTAYALASVLRQNIAGRDVAGLTTKMFNGLSIEPRSRFPSIPSKFAKSI